eukprot:Gb_41197 [translate_table: standard]
MAAKLKSSVCEMEWNKNVLKNRWEKCLHDKRQWKPWVKDEVADLVHNNWRRKLLLWHSEANPMDCSRRMRGKLCTGFKRLNGVLGHLMLHFEDVHGSNMLGRPSSSYIAVVEWLLAVEENVEELMSCEPLGASKPFADPIGEVLQLNDA